MKKTFFKYISFFLCAITLSTQVLFGCLTVRTYAEENVVQWFTDNFIDSVSAIGGAIYNSTEECWNAWKRILGLDTQEEVEQYINDNVFLTGHTGGGYDVRFSDRFKTDMDNFNNAYQNEITDMTYVYSDNMSLSAGSFQSRSRFENTLRFMRSHQDGCILYHSYYGIVSDPTSPQDYSSVQHGGRSAFLLLYVPTYNYCVYYSDNGSSKYNTYLFNYDWNKIKGSQCEVWGFAQIGDTELSKIGNLNEFLNSNNDDDLLFCRFYKNPATSGGLITSNSNASYSEWTAINYTSIKYIMFSSASVAQNYSVGNLPYYQVPTNPNVQYTNGSYNITSTQLDNSISYGNVSSYVDSNNVTSYETVVNYVNNYYTSGGGSGSGGSGSCGSGSDIDWGWLGNIGEVIGGLISALGNVISGIIDAISNLITSITENLPNVFGGLISWALPFLPEELTTLISLTIVVIVIVGVIKLIRGH